MLKLKLFDSEAKALEKINFKPNIVNCNKQTFPFQFSHKTLSRWKRRFGNRAEADLSPEEMEAGEPEMLEETTALGKPEHYLLNNKIFPNGKSEEVKDKVECHNTV